MSYIGLGWEDHQQFIAQGYDGIVRGARDNTTLGRKPHPAELQPKSRVLLQESNQAELRQKLQINRARWLANAKSLPLSQYNGTRFLTGKVSDYAVMIGLAAMISLTGSSLFLFAGGASKLAKTSSAPTVARVAITNKILSEVASR